MNQLFTAHFPLVAKECRENVIQRRVWWQLTSLAERNCLFGVPNILSTIKDWDQLHQRHFCAVLQDYCALHELLMKMNFTKAVAPPFVQPMTSLPVTPTLSVRKYGFLSEPTRGDKWQNTATENAVNLSLMLHYNLWPGYLELRKRTSLLAIASVYILSENDKTPITKPNIWEWNNMYTYIIVFSYVTL